MSLFGKLKNLVIGRPLNPFSPIILQHVSLIALLAWVGLGADGLSSACYGPEEAYIALGSHTHLAIYIALAMAITVFIISIGYNQVIELFPSGGGGYKVTTQLLGSYVGLISGAALLIDYVLTITVSAASGMDAFFSILPIELLSYKFDAEVLLIVFLLTLNLRGMKESIKFLLPVFMGFFIVHVGLIVYGIAVHSRGLIPMIPSAFAETQTLTQSIGLLPVLALLLHAYSLGSGTYTGLETVSNNVNRLTEPRVQTGKWTMLYMATSLSFTAAGIIILYLLWDAQPVAGQTLNAVVFHSILGDSTGGHIALIITLVLEAGLLLTAANTGFIAGPGVLANMAADGWVPNRFRHLSSRLVVQNGVILFGITALLILWWSHGKVSLLVILYSINVFITFSLSLLGLCVYWAKQRKKASPNWPYRLAFSFFAFVITTCILCITLFAKFTQGGWMTLLITFVVVCICLLIKKHYRRVSKRLQQLDVQLKQAIPDKSPPPVRLDPHQPTAVILIGKSSGVAMHTLLCVMRIFPRHFKNFIFISNGIVDVGSFAGQIALETMRLNVNETLQYFVDYCHQYGIAAQAYATFGTDPVDELSRLANEVSEKFPGSIFFASKLIFEHDNWIMRILHNETSVALQRQLHLNGQELVILPMKI
jgi:amino acid transporter